LCDYFKYTLYLNGSSRAQDFIWLEEDGKDLIVWVESGDVDEVGFYEVEIIAQLGVYRNVTHTLMFNLTITEPEVVIVVVEEELEEVAEI
jgi:hypothetical protein